MKKIDYHLIAEKADVSLSTVYRFVRNQDSVTLRTQIRLLKAIDDLNLNPEDVLYDLNKSTALKYIGIIFPDLSDPVYTEIIKGAAEECSNNGFNYILTTTGSSEDKAIQAIRSFVLYGCEGIIYLGYEISDRIKKNLKKSPCEVVLGCVKDFEGEINSVLIDQERAAYDLARELIKSGNKHLAILLNEKNLEISQLRLNGIIKALKEKKFPIDPDLILYDKADMNSGYNLAEDILDSGKDVDIILCFNDEMALGALKKIRESGLRIPEEIQVTGFNDDQIASIITPGLTTVRLPYFNLGLLAAKKLIIQIFDTQKKETVKDEIEDTQYVQYELIERDSAFFASQ